ncbi:unnamed protein product [Allacma fusca]|uniref:Uncharacterized protein n=1 Tax=Allacma fusca TaxID=39272 RepID=A0A8J2KCJ3_9HEXA|nr:unnamed protein product [Allacma fusca]
MFIAGRVIQFLVQLAFHSNGEERIDPASVTLLCTFLIFSLMGTMNHFNYVWKQDEWVAFYNEMVILRNKMLANEHNQKQERLRSGIFGAIVAVRTFGIISSAGKFPNRNQYIYSMLPLKWRTPLTYKIFMVYSIHTAASYVSSMYFVIGAFLIYFSTMKSAFEMSCQGKPLTRKRCTTYRSLQVLSNHFNDCFSAVGFPGIVACLLGCFITSMYGFVRFLTQRGSLKNFKSFPLTALAATMSLLMMLPSAGNFYKFSNQEKWNMAHKSQICCGGPRERKICQKKVLSFPNVGVSFSSLFLIKPGTVLFLLSFAFIQTISMLINF